MSLCKKLNKIKPVVVKGVTNALQGYMFGCMMGLFVGSNQPNLKSIHNSGKDVAKICIVYSVTEAVLENLTKREDLQTRMVSGIITGGICSKGKKKSYSTLLGSLGLGLYSGFSK